jgi:hypothetical protein
VNEKNSWSLDLINHMGRDINEASADGGEEITNFQRAAGTLEAGKAQRRKTERQMPLRRTGPLSRRRRR